MATTTSSNQSQLLQGQQAIDTTGTCCATVMIVAMIPPCTQPWFPIPSTFRQWSLLFMIFTSYWLPASHQFPLAPNLSSGGVARSRRGAVARCRRRRGRGRAVERAGERAPSSARSPPLIVRAGYRWHAATSHAQRHAMRRTQTCRSLHLTQTRFKMWLQKCSPSSWSDSISTLANQTLSCLTESVRFLLRDSVEVVHWSDRLALVGGPQPAIVGLADLA